MQKAIIGVNALRRAYSISTQDLEILHLGTRHCVNALRRAYSISTDTAKIIQQYEDGVNALRRAYSISTLLLMLED